MNENYIKTPQERIDPYSLNMSQIINCISIVDQMMKEKIINFDINDNKVDFIYDEALRSLSTKVNKLRTKNIELKDFLKSQKLYVDNSNLEDLKEWLDEKICNQNQDNATIKIADIREKIFLLEAENYLLGCGLDENSR